MNGAEILVRMLSAYGVAYIFGVPGDTNVALYQALKILPDAPTHILCRDERSAVFMADCYARMTGRPAVAEVPSGAGAMYGLPGVAEANKSSVPLILLVNDIPRAGVGRGTLTELPIDDLFRPICKHVETLRSVEKLPEMTRRALRIATGGRPGAVVMALPEDLLYATPDVDALSLHIEPECRHAPAFRVRPGDTELKAATKALCEAKRPLLVAGGGANRSGAASAILALSEKLQLPVVTTITGQGVMPDDHPLAIGIVGDNGFHPHAVWALGQADVVLYVGCRMGSVATMNWKLPDPCGRTRIIQIDIDPETVANTYPVAFPLVGDARAVLDSLIEVASTSSADATWVTGINERRAAFWEQATAVLLQPKALLHPERVMEALNRHLPSPCHVVSDAGTPTPYSTRFLKLNDPRSQLVIPRFYGGLGYAIPAAVGAYYADPTLRPIALFGDGSLGMSAGELETIGRLNIPVVMLHFNNSCFGWIKALQRVHHSGPQNEGSFQVDFASHDMSRLAQVYGINGVRVETPEELEEALSQAFSKNSPTFLDIAVESIADRLPPVFSWLTKVGADPHQIGLQVNM